MIRAREIKHNPTRAQAELVSVFRSITTGRICWHQHSTAVRRTHSAAISETKIVPVHGLTNLAFDRALRHTPCLQAMSQDMSARIYPPLTFRTPPFDGVPRAALLLCVSYA